MRTVTKKTNEITEKVLYLNQLLEKFLESIPSTMITCHLYWFNTIFYSLENQTLEFWSFFLSCLIMTITTSVKKGFYSELNERNLKKIEKTDYKG